VIDSDKCMPSFDTIPIKLWNFREPFAFITNMRWYALLSLLKGIGIRASLSEVPAYSGHSLAAMPNEPCL